MKGGREGREGNRIRTSDLQFTSLPTSIIHQGSSCWPLYCIASW